MTHPGEPDLRFDHRLRAACDRFVHHPVTEMVIVGLIIASVILLVLGPGYDHTVGVGMVIETAGDALTWLFVFELVLRLWVAPKKRRFFRRYWIDIIAVLPITRPLRFFRVLRLLRLFRAGMLLNRRMSIFGGALRSAMNEITLLGTVASVLILASAVTLYIVERENPAFSNMESTLWYSVNSLVGGEPIGGEPHTNAARGVTLTLMFGGLTIFGIFVGTISASMVSRLSKRMSMNELDLDELSKHVVICGWNASGRQVLRELFVAGSRKGGAVVLITDGDQLPEDVPADVLRSQLLYHVKGDFTKVAVLEQANVATAAVVLLLSDTLSPRTDQDRDARTVLASLTVEKLAPGIFTCAELCNRENASLLEMAGVEEIVVPDEYSGAIMGSVGRTRGLVRVLDEIFTKSYGNAFHKVKLSQGLVGKTVGDVHELLKREHNAILVSIETPPDKDGKVATLVNPESDVQLTAGTVLVVISSADIVL